MQTSKGYRTSEKKLLQFTESSMVLALDDFIPVRVTEIFATVTRMIQHEYGGNRLLAETDCVNKFVAKTGLKEKYNDAEKQVLIEVAFWAEAYKITEFKKLDSMKEMIRIKPKDVYAYQELLLDFFLSKNSNVSGM